MAFNAPRILADDVIAVFRKRVSPTCLITFERNRYSVPASFANRPVSLHVYPERLVIVAEGHVVCAHERIIERSHQQPGRVIDDWRHYLALAMVARTLYGWLPRGKGFSVDAGMVSVAAMYAASRLQHGRCAP
jgi:hypothetical protein